MRKLIFIMGILFVVLPIAAANTVYISQAGGTFTGGSACNGQTAQTFTYFNTSGNWTSGTPTGSQIGPGTTVYLCGTFTSAIQFQGSGSASGVITLKFDTGANFTAPVFSPYAIDLHGQSYILVDGGTPCGVTNGVVTTCSTNQTGTGIIQNTANGTSLANQLYSDAIHGGYTGGPDSGTCGSNIEIKNLLILNLYIRVSGLSDTSTAAQGSNGTQLVGCGSNIYIHDSTSTWSHTGFGASTASSITNWDISNNVSTHHVWGVLMALGSSPAVPTNWRIHDNDINLGNEWSNTNDGGIYHLDGVFVYGQSTTGYANGVYVYNNYVHGNFSDGLGNDCPTGYFYINQNLQNVYVFNNVVQLTANYACNGALSTGSGNVSQWFFNNDFIGYSPTSGGGIAIGNAGGNASASTTIENNIVYDFPTAINFSANSAALITVDHNDYFNINGAGAAGMWVASGYYNSFSGTGSWQAAGWDANGKYADPKLAATYPFTLGSGSAAIGLGANLYSTCNGQPNPGLGALCYDKNGNARPSSGNWDAGAYNSGTRSGIVQPPSGLTATIM